MTEAMIAVDVDEVWADDTGGDWPPLVLLHPGIGDSRIWNPILPALTASHRVIRYDARGYGKSPAPTAKYTLLDDLLAVLNHFGIERTAIVGSSMGGDTALGLAVTQPQRVSALVLLCPGISGYPVAEDPELGVEFQRAAAVGVDALAAIGLRLWAAAGPTPEITEQMRSGARAWISTSAFEQSTPPVYDRLREIAMPTSILVGDLDQQSLIDSNLSAAERIPGCELTQVGGLDHLPTIRVPERVVQLIADTLARA